MIDSPIVAIDIGTSSIKAARVYRDGKVERIVRVSTPTAASGGPAWIRSASAATHEALSGVQPRAIIISGNGPTIVPVDSGGDQVAAPLMWHDERSVARLEEAPSFFLQRIAWLYRNNPDAAERTRWFISCAEYLVFALSGHPVTIRPNEAFTPYIWDDSQAARYGVDAAKLPPFVSTGDLLEPVSGGRGEAWGIADGTPIVAGGYDFLMSLVGTGTLRPGRTCDRAGTSEGINHCSDHPSSDSRIRSLPHMLPGRYNVAGVLSSTGRLFEWFRTISGQRSVDYQTMMKAILERDPGHTPWFFPSVHQGANWEFSSGMFVGLGAEHDATDMGRAVVESIGFAVRESVEMLESAGFPIASLRACGGQSRNRLWNQMKCNMIGKPIEVPRVKDAEIIGNAIAGFVGLGEFARLDDAADEIVRIAEVFEPEKGSFDRYSECYAAYCRNYTGFRTAFAEAKL